MYYSLIEGSDLTSDKKLNQDFISDFTLYMKKEKKELKEKSVIAFSAFSKAFKEDPSRFKLASKVETFDLEEPRGRILALLNAL